MRLFHFDVFLCIHIIKYYFNAVVFFNFSSTVLSKFVVLHISKSCVSLVPLALELSPILGCIQTDDFLPDPLRIKDRVWFYQTPTLLY